MPRVQLDRKRFSMWFQKSKLGSTQISQKCLINRFVYRSWVGTISGHGSNIWIPGHQTGSRLGLGQIYSLQVLSTRDRKEGCSLLLISWRRGASFNNLCTCILRHVWLSFLKQTY
ncbi:hypothetical protein HanIR_Chr07g0318191 [Helianthus annuus]|nr:hypothetical protein HanIR_Chr07g0318191 [Helianthus annuus]